MPSTVSIRHVVPAFAQVLSSSDCTNSGSNQVNADVSRHSHTEANQAQSQANQCTSPQCPTGNTGTTSTEDESSSAEHEESSSPSGELSATGSCFPDGEDEPSDTPTETEPG